MEPKDPRFTVDMTEHDSSYFWLSATNRANGRCMERISCMDTPLGECFPDGIENFSKVEHRSSVTVRYDPSGSLRKRLPSRELLSDSLLGPIMSSRARSPFLPS